MLFVQPDNGKMMNPVPVTHVTKLVLIVLMPLNPLVLDVMLQDTYKLKMETLTVLSHHVPLVYMLTITNKPVNHVTLTVVNVPVHTIMNVLIVDAPTLSYTMPNVSNHVQKDTTEPTVTVTLVMKPVVLVTDKVLMPVPPVVMLPT
jgi:hypothetical protein